jgi:8-oxo-dGTP diphosphatase
MKIVFVAACAVLDADHRVLLAKRPEGKTLAGLWELPGGKVELNERPEDTLIRELREEVNITVKEDCLAPLTFASHAYDDFHLFMPVWVCRRWQGPERALEGQELSWALAKDLRNYSMPSADLPLIPVLQDLLR